MDNEANYLASLSWALQDLLKQIDEKNLVNIKTLVDNGQLNNLLSDTFNLVKDQMRPHEQDVLGSLVTSLLDLVGRRE